MDIWNLSKCNLLNIILKNYLYNGEIALLRSFKGNSQPVENGREQGGNEIFIS